MGRANAVFVFRVSVDQHRSVGNCISSLAADWHGLLDNWCASGRYQPSLIYRVNRRIIARIFGSSILMKVTKSRAASAFFGGAIFAVIAQVFLTLYAPLAGNIIDHMFVASVLSIGIWVAIAMYFFLSETHLKAWLYLAGLTSALLSAILLAFSGQLV